MTCHTGDFNPGFLHGLCEVNMVGRPRVNVCGIAECSSGSSLLFNVKDLSPSLISLLPPLLQEPDPQESPQTPRKRGRPPKSPQSSPGSQRSPDGFVCELCLASMHMAEASPPCAAVFFRCPVNGRVTQTNAVTREQVGRLAVPQWVGERRALCQSCILRLRSTTGGMRSVPGGSDSSLVLRMGLSEKCDILDLRERATLHKLLQVVTETVGRPLRLQLPESAKRMLLRKTGSAKKRKVFPREVEDRVREVYEDASVQDATARLVSGERKRYLLCRASALYAKYAEDYPSDGVSRTRFFSLRPRHVHLRRKEDGHACSRRVSVELLLGDWRNLSERVCTCGTVPPESPELFLGFFCSSRAYDLRNGTRTVDMDAVCVAGACEESCGKIVWCRCIDALAEQEVPMHEFRRSTFEGEKGVKTTVVVVLKRASEWKALAQSTLRMYAEHKFVHLRQDEARRDIANDPPGTYAILSDYAARWRPRSERGPVQANYNPRNTSVLVSLLGFTPCRDGPLRYITYYSVSPTYTQDRLLSNAAHHELLTHLQEKGIRVSSIWTDGGPHFKSRGLISFLLEHRHVVLNVRCAEHGKDLYDAEGGVLKAAATDVNLRATTFQPSIPHAAALVEWGTRYFTDPVRTSSARILARKFRFLSPQYVADWKKAKEKNYEALKGIRAFHSFAAWEEEGHTCIVGRKISCRCPVSACVDGCVNRTRGFRRVWPVVSPGEKKKTKIAKPAAVPHYKAEIPTLPRDDDTEDASDSGTEDAETSDDDDDDEEDEEHEEEEEEEEDTMVDPRDNADTLYVPSSSALSTATPRQFAVYDSSKDWEGGTRREELVLILEQYGEVTQYLDVAQRGNECGYVSLVRAMEHMEGKRVTRGFCKESQIRAVAVSLDIPYHHSATLPMLDCFQVMKVLEQHGHKMLTATMFPEVVETAGLRGANVVFLHSSGGRRSSSHHFIMITDSLGD